MSECEKLLRDAGAQLVRNGRGHTIYELGGRRVLVCRGSHCSPCLLRQTRSIIRQHRQGKPVRPGRG